MLNLNLSVLCVFVCLRRLEKKKWNVCRFNIDNLCVLLQNVLIFSKILYTCCYPQIVLTQETYTRLTLFLIISQIFVWFFPLKNILCWQGEHVNLLSFFLSLRLSSITETQKIALISTTILKLYKYLLTYTCSYSVLLFAQTHGIVREDKWTKKRSIEIFITFRMFLSIFDQKIFVVFFLIW